MCLMRFNIESMVQVPGKEMYAPDTLSRMLVRNKNTVHIFVCSVLDAIQVSDVKLQQIIDSQDQNEVWKTFKQYCFEGWPEKHILSTTIKSYGLDRGQLTIFRMFS